jgi:hypothetical protein
MRRLSDPGVTMSPGKNVKKPMTNYIVQFGSGKPGELGTEKTEREVFKRIGIKNPKIGFAPFHHLFHGAANDWTLFQDLVQPLTSEKIQLMEFHEAKDLEALKKQILDCDIFVLGSGVCEPYLEFIFKNRLDTTFREFFKRGKSILGYSAGSIAVCAQYIHVVFFREVLMHWKAISQHLDQKEVDEFKQQMIHEPTLGSSELAELLDSEDEVDPMDHPLSMDVFHVSKMSSMGFLPHIAMLPHYGEAIHATADHLRSAAINFPRYHHYGIPNGVTLFHTFEDQKLVSSEVVGQNRLPQLKVTRFFPKTTKEFSEGDKLPLSNEV